MERDAVSSRTPQPFCPFVKGNPGLPEDALFHQVPNASGKFQPEGTAPERPHEEGQPVAGSGIWPPRGRHLPSPGTLEGTERFMLLIVTGSHLPIKS